MVVSEMNDRLSPNMAPPMTEATHSGRLNPEAAATAGDRRDERDGAHRRAHRKRHEAAHHEQHRHGVLGGNDRQHEVGHRLGGITSHGANEHAGRHEDKDHGDDGLVPDASAHDDELVVKGKAAILEARHQKRHQKDHHDGDVIEPHGNAHAVLEQNAEPQIQHEEYPDGQKRRHISLFHVAP